ncbi:MAG: MFS transporter [Sulfolobales archaeon]
MVYTRRIMILVLLFGLVSMLADITYEGARSVIPQYIAYIGGDATTVGIISGAGELAGYVLRFVSGFVASRYGLLWALTMGGYLLTGLSIALMSIVKTTLGVGLLVAGERMGKGLRTPPRDALLGRLSRLSGGSGRIFGIHGALDQVGAVVGPLIVLVMLSLKTFGSVIEALFLTISIPAFISVLILLIARSLYPREIEEPPKGFTFKIFRGLLGLYILSIVVPLISLVSLSLAVYYVGSRDPAMGALYFLVIQIIHIPSALLLGFLYDRFGYSIMLSYFILIPLIALGLILTPYLLLLLGIVLSIEESIQRALIADLARGNESAAFGFYHLAYGLGALVGGYVVGFLIDHGLLRELITLSLVSSAIGLGIFIHILKNLNRGVVF